MKLTQDLELMISTLFLIGIKAPKSLWCLLKLSNQDSMKPNNKIQIIFIVIKFLM